MCISMSHVVLRHHKSAPGDQIFVCVLQKFARVTDGAEDVGAEEAAKLAQWWKVAGITDHKLDPSPVL